jgi:hypothetical protein
MNMGYITVSDKELGGYGAGIVTTRNGITTNHISSFQNFRRALDGDPTLPQRVAKQHITEVCRQCYSL